MNGEDSSYYTNPEAELQANGVYASNTVGSSMRPFLKTHRDVVIVRKPGGEVRRLDVVLYRLPSGKYVLHRVIAVKNGFYLIRGDNTYVTEKVPENAVIGVLSEFVRAGKRGTVNDFSYRFYASVWTAVYPLRAVIYPFAKKIRDGIRRSGHKTK